jgi:LysM repeat protein
MRYTNNRTKRTIDGKEIFVSKIYPDIPEQITDTYVATETGDRLDTLAYQFYKDSNFRWIIAAANKIHNAPIGFEDGTILRIPANPQQILDSTIR